jgi:hypothetical protein
MPEESRPVGKPPKNFLASLTPEQVAADAGALFARTLTRLALLAEPHAVRLPTLEQLSKESQVAWSVQQLTHYAQTGDGGDWGTGREAAQCALDCLVSTVAVACYSGDLAEARLSAEEPLDCVVLATLARVAIAEREDVSAKRLGALAGLTARMVRTLAKSGELAAEGDPLMVPAKEARRWLSGRGVKGL